MYGPSSVYTPPAAPPLPSPVKVPASQTQVPTEGPYAGGFLSGLFLCCVVFFCFVLSFLVLCRVVSCRVVLCCFVLFWFCVVSCCRLYKYASVYGSAAGISRRAQINPALLVEKFCPPDTSETFYFCLFFAGYTHVEKPEVSPDKFNLNSMQMQPAPSPPPRGDQQSPALQHAMENGRAPDGNQASPSNGYSPSLGAGTGLKKYPGVPGLQSER